MHTAIRSQAIDDSTGTSHGRACAWWALLLLLMLAAAWPLASLAASPYFHVRIQTPADGAWFHTPTDIELVATTNAPSACVAIEFLANGVSLGPAQIGSTRSFTWRNVAAGNYQIVARALCPASLMSSPAPIPVEYSPPVQIDVHAQVIHPQLAPNAPALQFNPGDSVSLPILAVDEHGTRVPGATLAWQIRTDSTQAIKHHCNHADTPVSGSLTTGADGSGLLNFTPGCASGNRHIVINAQGMALPLDLTLRGPDDRAGAIALTSGATMLVLPPATATPVSFTVRDMHDDALGSATLDFSLTPADAGNVDASMQADDNGVAAPMLTLTRVTAATLTACVRNRPGLCLQVPVRNAGSAIADPAATLLGPIAQQALDAPAAQFDNIGNHLRSLRNGRGGFSNDIQVQTGDGTLGGTGGSKEEDSRVSVFAAGSIDLGKRDAQGAIDGFDATTRGLTLGADVRATPSWVVGAAIGGMRAHTKVADGGRQSARGTSAAIYAQWLPTERAYVNAALNFGGEDFDVRRMACQGELRSKTSAEHRALSVEAGYSFAGKAVRFTPYLRYQYIHAALDDLIERGNCSEALRIDKTALTRSSFVAGASIDHAFSTRSGVWVPSLSVEFLDEDQRYDAIFARLLAGGPAVPVQLAAHDRRYATARFSLSWMTSLHAHPLSAFFGLDADIGRSDYDSRTFMLGLRIPF